MKEPKIFNLMLGNNDFDEIANHYEHNISLSKNRSDVGENKNIITYSLYCNDCSEKIITFVKPKDASKLDKKEFKIDI